MIPTHYSKILNGVVEQLIIHTSSTLNHGIYSIYSAYSIYSTYSIYGIYSAYSIYGIYHFTNLCLLQQRRAA
mgnify:FL=1